MIIEGSLKSSDEYLPKEVDALIEEDITNLEKK